MQQTGQTKKKKEEKKEKKIEIKIEIEIKSRNGRPVTWHR